MINKIKKCTQNINDKHFFIIDDKQNKPAYIVSNNGEFEIINKNTKELCFLAIDDCIYDSTDGTRCDCAIYDDKTFSFIELKHTKRTSWKNSRETAQTQLETAIKEFENLDIISNKKLEAYMCCTCKIDTNYTKISKASIKSEIIVYFQDELNITLYCDNKKEFI